MTSRTIALREPVEDDVSKAALGHDRIVGDAAGGVYDRDNVGIGAETRSLAGDIVGDGEIGALLNLEFVHSEPISDAGALTTFIENSYASGCDAVLTNVSNAIDQAAAVCNDLGLYFVGISSSNAAENQDLPCYVSVCGASAEGYGDSYAEALTSVVGDGAEHSILILSGAACYGATSFIEGTVGSLRALEDVYGLTYNEDLNALATSSVQVEAENDKGVRITIMPGMEDLANMVSPLLQTGDYDVVVGTTDIYGSLSIAINEVEEALGKNINIISRNTFSEMVGTAFNSQDSTGHPALNAIVCTGLYEFLAGIIVLRNALDGYVEQMRTPAPSSTMSCPAMTCPTLSSPKTRSSASAVCCTPRSPTRTSTHWAPSRPPTI